MNILNKHNKDIAIKINLDSYWFHSYLVEIHHSLEEFRRTKF